MTPTSRHACYGFTYIGLLLAVALVGAGLAAIGQVWHTNVQRSREAELHFIGEQFKRAIKLYYDSTPGGDKQLPKSLEDLLRDTRYPVVRRYLRKVYADPMRGKAEWGLIKPNNGEGIVGVYSLSEGEPFKRRDAEIVTMSPKTRVRYADWRFVADIAFVPEKLIADVAAIPVPAQLPLSAPTPEPVAPPAETSPPTVTPRPKPSTERCERLRASDDRTCAASALRRGSSDSDCESSAALRYSGCVAGSNGGPLWVTQ